MAQWRAARSVFVLRAFVQTGIGEYDERELPVPRPGPGEAVVRVLAAVLCGTDVKLLRRGHSKIALPRTMGHELCGEVISVGEGVDPGLVGARVVPGISGPCGACPECLGGFSNLCAEAHADQTWGAFAEYVRIPASVVRTNLHRVPESLSDTAAAFVDPLASVLHGWGRLKPLPAAATLLVYGAGAIAFLWAATARLRGISCTIAARRPERRSMAERFGARFLDVSAGSPTGLFSLAVDATGDPDVWSLLPFLVSPGGRVLLYGGCAPGVVASFDAARLHYAEISLIGSFHSTPAEAAEALALLASGTIEPLPLVSASGGLDQLPVFLESQARGEGLRHAVRPDAG
ncbi:MAG: alcohol dehydrogenase catalytic domain-containing protein [Acidobacteriota bacterium]